MNKSLERQAARMILKNAAVNSLIVARLPHTTAEEIESQKERRRALYESVYQAKQILSRSHRRSDRARASRQFNPYQKEAQQ